jgi:hypothetical protein
LGLLDVVTTLFGDDQLAARHQRGQIDLQIPIELLMCLNRPTCRVC